jgi:fumarate reductase flavoprotein subunit
MGVDLETATPVTSIMKKNQLAASVIVCQNDESVEVATRAIVAASGGYANREWVKEYAGLDLGVNVFPVGNVDKTGDGIRMAWEVGAAAEGLGVLEFVSRRPRRTGIPYDGQNRIPSRPA